MLGQLMESKEFFPTNVANLVNYVHVEIVAPVVTAFFSRLYRLCECVVVYFMIMFIITGGGSVGKS
jgi:hypothetical protein